MAEFDALDSRLRDALGQAAQPGDPTGVADVIRSRVAAGDPGTSVASSTAPGWGGSGALGWLPWIGVVVAVGITGGAVGASGLLGGPIEAQQHVVGISIASETVPASGCAGGPVVETIPAGTPVLAVARDESGQWLGVRDPASPETVVWVAAGAFTLDDGQSPVSDLPIGGGCPVVVTPTPTPTPTPTSEPAPEPAPPPQPQPVPQPQPDTTAPTVQAASSTPVVYWMNGDPSVTISATATDDRGVVSATVSWSGQASGSQNMTFAGGVWSYTYDPPGSQTLPTSDLTFVVTARDAAGNTGTSTVIVKVSP